MKLSSIMKPFVFFTLGDWGGYSPNSLKMMSHIAEQFSFVAKYKPPEFICALGDNFYDQGIDSEDSERWNTHYNDIYIKPYPNLHNVPWYAILGNHDYYGGLKSINAEILHSRKSNNWNLPYYYYYFCDPTNSAYFIYIDTCNIYPELYEETNEMIIEYERFLTLTFLREKLKEAKKNNAKWIFVFGHYHIFSNGFYNNYEIMEKRLLPLLIEYDVDVYFCGHDHTFQHLKYKNTHFVVNGAGTYYANVTKENNNPEVETKYVTESNGFTFHDITDDSFSINFRNYKGETEYSYTIKKEN